MRKGTPEIPPAEARQERASGPSRARHTSGTWGAYPVIFPRRSSRSSCLATWDSGQTACPRACALVEKAAFAPAVLWRDVGGGGDGYRDSRSAVGMIHELLLALSGYPGSIFTWNKRSGLQVRSSPCAGTRERRMGGPAPVPGGGVCEVEGRGLQG